MINVNASRSLINPSYPTFYAFLILTFGGVFVPVGGYLSRWGGICPEIRISRISRYFPIIERPYLHDYSTDFKKFLKNHIYSTRSLDCAMFWIDLGPLKDRMKSMKIRKISRNPPESGQISPQRDKYPPKTFRN